MRARTLELRKLLSEADKEEKLGDEGKADLTTKARSYRAEPEALRRGKAFHKLIQAEWLETATGGTPKSEKTIKRVSGRKGRIDILLENMGDVVAVVEIKGTDWDRIKKKNVKRNIRRQIRQIWSYVDAQLEVYEKEVCPGGLKQ